MLVNSWLGTPARAPGGGPTTHRRRPIAVTHRWNVATAARILARVCGPTHRRGARGDRARQAAAQQHLTDARGRHRRRCGCRLALPYRPRDRSRGRLLLSGRTDRGHKASCARSGQQVNPLRHWSERVFNVEAIGRNSNLAHLCKKWAELRKRISESTRRPASSGTLPRSKRFLVPTDIDDIVRRYDAGETTEQIGAHYGISKTRVALVLREQDVTIRRQGLTEDRLSEA